MKSLYIASNLSAVEAVNLYEELQICPEIMEWAEAYDHFSDPEAGEKINRYDALKNRLRVEIADTRSAQKKQYTKRQVLDILEELNARI